MDIIRETKRRKKTRGIVFFIVGYFLILFAVGLMLGFDAAFIISLVGIGLAALIYGISEIIL